MWFKIIENLTDGKVFFESSVLLWNRILRCHSVKNWSLHLADWITDLSTMLDSKKDSAVRN